MDKTSPLFGGAAVVNATDVPDGDIHDAFATQQHGLLSALSNWVQETRLSAAAVGSTDAVGHRQGGLFGRDRYVTPLRPFQQMRTAYDAVASDDIVSGVAEATESLVFSSMSFFAADKDEQDAYNQIAAKIDLDSRMREIWRELFTVSQAYVAVWWEQQEFKIRGTTKAGNQRRRTISMVAPSELTLLDPLRVVPVGNTLFQKEQLAYIALPTESARFENILSLQEPADEIVSRLIISKYEPERFEQAELSELGINPRHLWLLNPRNVFRHTLTRPSYQRLAPVRLKAVFELLDMKNQLRQMERAHLIGGTNFIILITQGSDQRPATPEEIANLGALTRVVARVPVFVGDHRLNIQIITPKLDNTLRAERWNTIDSRITARLYQMFMLGNYSAGAGGDDSVKLVKVIARGMESRRHMIRRTLEKYIFRPMWENNDELSSFPKLQFHPRSIALDFDAAYASFLFDLRQANELSRETILNQFDLDQDLEAEYRKREKDEFDDIFITQVPFSTPNPANPANTQQPAQPSTGPRDNGGGRRNGGGAAPGTGQGQEPRRRAARPAADYLGGAFGEDVTPVGPMPLADEQGDGDADADDPT